MNELIFYADRIVSVKHPYIEDNFVNTHCHPIGEVEASNLIQIYKDISAKNRLLTYLIKLIGDSVSNAPINIVDVGVFMGSFTNAASIACRELGIEAAINSYEANPRLIASILDNLAIYHSKAFLHWAAVGRDYGTMELVVSPGGAIGGSLANPQSRKYGDYFSCHVDVVPLKSIIPSNIDLCLIKIDIEGFEVPAFSSIEENADLLKNIFIVEYSPKQAAQEVSAGYKYADFLMDHYNIFNIGNWGWIKRIIPVELRQDLYSLDLGNGGSNTDILLLPKNLDVATDVVHLYPD